MYDKLWDILRTKNFYLQLLFLWFHEIFLQLNNYLIKEKLPQEITSLQKELSVMQFVAAEEHPTRSDLVVVQDKV